MSYNELTLERRGPLAIVTLQRPAQLNALTYTLIQEIERAVREAEADGDVAAICITGAGKGFCAGVDMSVLTVSARGEGEAEEGPPGPPLFGFLLDVSKPVIAAVNGVAAGGGFVLAMMCDLRFFGELGNVTTVFSRRGLIAEHGTSWLLPRITGLSRALDLLWSSRRVDAQEAHRIGLADRVVPNESLLDEVAAYVDAMVATVAPRMLAVIKQQVLSHLERPFLDAAQESARLMRKALVHPDAKEGAVSFVERRPPRFEKWKGGKAY